MERTLLEDWLKINHLEIVIEKKIPSNLSMPWCAFIPGLTFVHGCVNMGAVEYGNTPEEAFNKLISLLTPHKVVIVRRQSLTLPIINTIKEQSILFIYHPSRKSEEIIEKLSS